MQRSGGVAAIKAERNEVFPDPGAPEMITDDEAHIAALRNEAAAAVSEPRSTNDSRVWRRSA
jgi:hypothetical protein